MNRIWKELKIILWRLLLALLVYCYLINKKLNGTGITKPRFHQGFTLRFVDHLRSTCISNPTYCIFWPAFWCCALQALVEICFFTLLALFCKILMENDENEAKISVFQVYPKSWSTQKPGSSNLENWRKQRFYTQ